MNSFRNLLKILTISQENVPVQHFTYFIVLEGFTYGTLKSRLRKLELCEPCFIYIPHLNIFPGDSSKLNQREKSFTVLQGWETYFAREVV